MLLLDRQRWLKVLYWTFWINTWHDRLYENYIYGDKVCRPLTTQAEALMSETQLQAAVLAEAAYLVKSPIF